METVFCLLGIIIGLVECKFSATDVMKIKEDFWLAEENQVSFSSQLSARVPTECINGTAVVNGITYPCDNVDFLSLVGRAELQRSRELFSDDSLFEMSDIWGWKSPTTDKEYTLACMTNLIWFIDSTDPTNPILLAYMESHRAESFWCDVKVYKNVAYVVQDKIQQGGVDRGIQVFNLTRLEDNEVLDSLVPPVLLPDFTYEEHGATHNVVIDNDSGFLFGVGINQGNTCSGGLHIVDLAEPLNPVFAGCASQDGYTHDAQCVTYSGPDESFQGNEICFAFNEDTLTIIDVTDKISPSILGKVSYNGAKYVHQGWLNADQDFIISNDELDEIRGSQSTTHSYIFNVASLENPTFHGSFDHKTNSIDHNMYFFGAIHKEGWGGNPPVENHPNTDYVYCANYATGLRILNTVDIKESPPNIATAGFFDVAPEANGARFNGAWSSYMHPSGVIAVTNIETGLFFLNFTQAFVQPTSPPPVTPDDNAESKNIADNLVFFAIIGVSAFVVVAVLGGIIFVTTRSTSKSTSNLQQDKPKFTLEDVEEPEKLGFTDYDL